VIWKPYWHTHAVSRLIRSTARSSHVHSYRRWKGVQSSLTMLSIIQFHELIKIMFNRPNDLLTMSSYFIYYYVQSYIANIYENYSIRIKRSRSQWPRSLRHELSSLARTLGSWVRIPLEAWMSVCVYSVCVLGSGLATGWSLVQGVLPNVLD
jgi:hypothetical protein